MRLSSSFKYELATLAFAIAIAFEQAINLSENIFFADRTAERLICGAMFFFFFILFLS